MITIHKFEIPSLNRIGIIYLQINIGYKILAVQIQNSIPVIWAIVDTSEDFTTLSLAWVNTGDEFIHKKSKYIGTVQLLGGSYISHLFELT